MDQGFESQFDPPKVGMMDIHSSNQPRSKGITDDYILQMKNRVIRRFKKKVRKLLACEEIVKGENLNWEEPYTKIYNKNIRLGVKMEKLQKFVKEWTRQARSYASHNRILKREIEVVKSTTRNNLNILINTVGL